MNLDLSSLPDDQSITKHQAFLLFNQLEEKYHAQIDYLEEQNRLLRNELFGRKSEKPIREDRDRAVEAVISAVWNHRAQPTRCIQWTPRPKRSGSS